MTKPNSIAEYATTTEQTRRDGRRPVDKHWRKRVATLAGSSGTIGRRLLTAFPAVRAAAWLAVGLVACLIVGVSTTVGFAQPSTTKKPAPKPVSKVPGKAGTNESAEAKGDFTAPPKSPKPPEGDKSFDQTAPGQAALKELQNSTTGLYVKYGRVREALSPRVEERSKLATEIEQLTTVAKNASDFINRNTRQLRDLNQQFNNAKNADQRNALADQIRTLQFQVNDAMVKQQAAVVEIAGRTTRVKALSTEIDELEKERRVLQSGLTDARVEWLDACDPMRKYASGDYEALLAQLAPWVEVDTLWPEAGCWAALCAFELGEFQQARGHLDRAVEARGKLDLSKAWASGDALRGLIMQRIPEQRGKASGELQDAASLLNKTKKPHWSELFFLGRAYAENDTWATKAKVQLEKATKANPEAQAPAHWLARVQSTTTNPQVRDPEAGMGTLKFQWDESKTRTWRMAHALAIACDAAGKTDAAEKFQEETLKLAPDTRHDALRKEWDDARRSRPAK